VILNRARISDAMVLVGGDDSKMRHESPVFRGSVANRIRPQFLPAWELNIFEFCLLY
jgi:hypothetical protein